MKKSLICSIIVSVVLTLTLAISTVITGFSSVPKQTVDNVYLAYRTTDELTELKSFKELSFNDSEQLLEYNADKGVYVAVKAGDAIHGTAVQQNGRKANLTIEVFEMGEGTAESPLAIANAKHLVDLADRVEVAGTEDDYDDGINVTAEGFTAKVVANIDMAGVEFYPIGSRGHKFTGTFLGNGKAISNLSINVTSENADKFIQVSAYKGNDEAFLDLGLFGYTKNATIKDVKLNHAGITVAEAVKTVVAESTEELGVATLRRVNVGALVGYAESTTISNEANVNISSTIRGFAYSKEHKMFSGLGGAVGVSDSSTISGLKVESKVVSTNVYAEDNYNMAGGVVGYAYASDINDVAVTTTINTVYNNASVIGGVAGYVYGASVVNAKVNVAVNGNEKFGDVVADQINDTVTTVVGGVAGRAANYVNTSTPSLNRTSIIENVKVNASIDVKGFVGGVVGENEGNVVDPTFSGTLVGYNVGAIARKNNGLVEFSSEYTGSGITSNLRGVKTAGMVVYNYADGEINGYIDDENKVNVKVTSNVVNVSLVTDENFAAALSQAYSAGLVCENRGAVKNFNVEAKLYNGLNVAGLVNNNYGEVSYNNVKTIVESVNLRNNVSTTYAVGGAVNYAYNGSKILNNIVEISLNKNVDTNKHYGAAEIGGLVTRVVEDDATNGVVIGGNTVSGSIYANDSYWTEEVGTKQYKVMLVGGLIGSVSSLDGRGQLDLTAFASNLEENMVNNLTIDVTLNESDYIDSVNVKVIRSVGSLIGSIANNSAITIDDSNAAYNVTIKFAEKDFTYKYENGLNITKFCYVETSYKDPITSEVTYYPYGSSANAVTIASYQATLIIR